MEKHDHVRQILMYEPRGHRDMYGAVIVEASDPENDFGVIFMHNEGYSTMCGHAIIALTKLAAYCSLKDPIVDQIQLRIETPCGLIRSWYNLHSEGEFAVGFIGVPSFVFKGYQPYRFAGLDPFHAEIAYGGAFYVYLEAKELQLALVPSNVQELISVAKIIKKIVSNSMIIKHPDEVDLSFLYGVIFREEQDDSAGVVKNVCIFADGELDRSPTGSGVCGYLACLYERGLLKLHGSMIMEGITGSRFRGTILEETDFHGYRAIVPQVEGNAYITGFNEWVLDQADPFKTGFLLR